MAQLEITPSLLEAVGRGDLSVKFEWLDGALVCFEFDESKHPRDERGRFAEVYGEPKNEATDIIMRHDPRVRAALKKVALREPKDWEEWAKFRNDVSGSTIAHTQFGNIIINKRWLQQGYKLQDIIDHEIGHVAFDASTSKHLWLKQYLDDKKFARFNEQAKRNADEGFAETYKAFVQNKGKPPSAEYKKPFEVVRKIIGTLPKKFFQPDEARDEHGRWTDSGSGNVGSWESGNGRAVFDHPQMGTVIVRARGGHVVAIGNQGWRQHFDSVDAARDWLKAEGLKPLRYESQFDPEEHPRGKTTEESNAGSFAPKEGSQADKVGKAAKEKGIAAVEKLKEKMLQGDATVEVESDDTEDEDSYTYDPQSWDEVSGDQQSEAEEQWKKDNYDSYLESEVDNYWEESYINDAARQVFKDQEDWGKDELQSLLEESGVDLGKSGLLDKNGNLDSSALGPIWGGSYKTIDSDGFGDAYSVEKLSMSDNTSLINPDILGKLVDEDGNHILSVADEKQPQLPDTPPPGDPINAQWTQDLLSSFEAKVTEKIGDANSWMEAPDYLGDSVSEYMGEAWDQMSDSQKYDVAKDKFGDEWGNGESDSSSTSMEKIVEPSEYKLISDGQEYAQTKALGNALTERRFAEVLAERDVLAKKEAIDKQKVSYDPIDQLKPENFDARHYINQLWSVWKGKSYHDEALAFQAATAEELGGNFYAAHTGKDFETIKKWADDHMQGGFEGMKAYVRAQWEVNQFLMSKAFPSDAPGTVQGVDHLDLYRAVMLTDEQMKGAEQQRIGHGSGIGYLATALPTLFVHQNGAASFTVDRGVANGWNGVGNNPEARNRVVIRARVPAESILSLPVFGKNLIGEQEVVVSGLPWHAWDAWKGTAPSFDDFDIKHPRGPDGRFIEVSDMPGDIPAGYTITKDASGKPNNFPFTVKNPDGTMTTWATKEEAVKAAQAAATQAPENVSIKGKAGGEFPAGYTIAESTDGSGWIVTAPGGTVLGTHGNYADAVKAANDHAFTDKAWDETKAANLALPDGFTIEPGDGYFSIKQNGVPYNSGNTKTEAIQLAQTYLGVPDGYSVLNDVSGGYKVMGPDGVMSDMLSSYEGAIQWASKASKTAADASVAKEQAIDEQLKGSGFVEGDLNAPGAPGYTITKEEGSGFVGQMGSKYPFHVEGPEGYGSWHSTLAEAQLAANKNWLANNTNHALPPDYTMTSIGDGYYQISYKDKVLLNAPTKEAALKAAQLQSGVPAGYEIHQLGPDNFSVSNKSISGFASAPTYLAALAAAQKDVIENEAWKSITGKVQDSVKGLITTLPGGYEVKVFPDGKYTVFGPNDYHAKFDTYTEAVKAASEAFKKAA